MSFYECYEQCPYYEVGHLREEERLPGCYETLVEPPTCKAGGGPYRDTWAGKPCPWLRGKMEINMSDVRIDLRPSVGNLSEAARTLKA